MQVVAKNGIGGVYKKKSANICTRIEMNVTGKDSQCEKESWPMCVQVQRSQDVAKSLQQTIIH